jgi:maltose alpha-D-glucosyltransferase / alpha-amylase
MSGRENQLGDFAVLRTNTPEVLAIRYDWRQTSMVTLHKFSNHEQKLRLRVGTERDELLVDVFDGRHSRRHSDGQHRITLEPYAWRWYRVGAPDDALDQSDRSVVRRDVPTARDPGKS